MVLFLFLSTILYLDTRFDYDDNMQDIDKWLVDNILICSANNITVYMDRNSFRFSYFQVVL